MLTCSHCSYSTDRLYNLNRHNKIHQKLCDTVVIDSTSSKEENTPNNVKNVSILEKNVSTCEKNVSTLKKNVSTCEKNVSIDFPNVAIETGTAAETEEYRYNSETKKYECIHCYKSYILKSSIQKHYCQKIQDPCECPTCHKILASRSCKSRHMKTCLPQDLVVLPKGDDNMNIEKETSTSSAIQQQTAEYIQNNIHKTTTNNVNSHNTNTNNIVVFHFNNEKPIPLHYDHITQKMIQELFNDSSYPMDSIREYAQKVLERPENLCVKKKHIRDPHSLVHVGGDKWEHRVDKEVFPRLTYNISSNLLEYIEAAQKRLHFSERLGEILNDVVSEKNPYYKETMNRIKLMVIDFTKSLLESKK